MTWLKRRLICIKTVELALVSLLPGVIMDLLQQSSGVLGVNLDLDGASGWQQLHLDIVTPEQCPNVVPGHHRLNEVGVGTLSQSDQTSSHLNLGRQRCCGCYARPTA